MQNNILSWDIGPALPVDYDPDSYIGWLVDDTTVRTGMGYKYGVISLVTSENGDVRVWSMWSDSPDMAKEKFEWLKLNPKANRKIIDGGQLTRCLFSPKDFNLLEYVGIIEDEKKSWDISMQVIASNFEDFKSLCKPYQVWKSSKIDADNIYLHIGMMFSFGPEVIYGDAKWRDIIDCRFNNWIWSGCGFSDESWPLTLIYENGEKLSSDDEFREISLDDDPLIIKTNEMVISELFKKKAWDNNDILNMFGDYDFKNFKPSDESHLSYAGWLVKGIGNFKKNGYGVCLPIVGFEFSLTKINPKYNDFDIVWGNGSIEKAMDCYKAYCNGEKIGPMGGNLGYCWDPDPSKLIEKVKFVGLPETNSVYWKGIENIIYEAKKVEKSGILKKNNPFKNVLKNTDAPKEESNLNSNDLKFDSNLSKENVEQNRKELIDEYLDDLNKAKAEGNTEKVNKINKMLQYLSAESSLKFSWDLPKDKIKFKTVAPDEISNPSGMHKVGGIVCDYNTMLRIFGRPTWEPYMEETVEWEVHIEDPEDEFITVVACIHDWEIGKGYLGESGIALEDINEWNISGITYKAVELIEAIIKENSSNKLSWDISPEGPEVGDTIEAYVGPVKVINTNMHPHLRRGMYNSDNNVNSTTCVKGVVTAKILPGEMWHDYMNNSDSIVYILDEAWVYTIGDFKIVQFKQSWDIPKVEYNAEGLVLGYLWGGGKGAYPTKSLTGYESIEALLQKANEMLGDGSLDRGMGFDSLIGAVLYVEKAIGKGPYEYEHIFIGDLKEDEKEFLDNQM